MNRFDVYGDSSDDDEAPPLPDEEPLAAIVAQNLPEEKRINPVAGNALVAVGDVQDVYNEKCINGVWYEDEQKCVCRPGMRKYGNTCIPSRGLRAGASLDRGYNCGPGEIRKGGKCVAYGIPEAPPILKDIAPPPPAPPLAGDKPMKPFNKSGRRCDKGYHAQWNTCTSHDGTKTYERGQALRCKKGYHATNGGCVQGPPVWKIRRGRYVKLQADGTYAVPHRGTPMEEDGVKYYPAQSQPLQFPHRSCPHGFRNKSCGVCKNEYDPEDTYPHPGKGHKCKPGYHQDDCTCTKPRRKVSVRRRKSTTRKKSTKRRKSKKSCGKGRVRSRKTGRCRKR